MCILIGYPDVLRSKNAVIKVAVRGWGVMERKSVKVHFEMLIFSLIILCQFIFTKTLISNFLADFVFTSYTLYDFVHI